MTAVTEVHLRPVTLDILAECLALRVADAQSGFVASNSQSLAEASVLPSLVPLAIYPSAARAQRRPTVPMVGFTMYEVVNGVGFIHRLMIDHAHQRQGYGLAATTEVRRLKLHPEVELIATSCRRSNIAAEKLYRSLGFEDWDIRWGGRDDPDGLYLQLEIQSVAQR